jgi:hypothetical protein
MLENTERACVTLNWNTNKNGLGKSNSENCAEEEIPGTQRNVSKIGN